MRAEILSVGTELLLGHVTDTNATTLSRALADLGIPLTHRITVGDNRDRLIEALRLAGSRADLIVTTGGLGPTPDDLTKECIAEAFGDQLVEHPESAENLRRFFELRGIALAPSNRKQALVFSSGFPLPNPNGTAPGVVLEKDGRTVICLPGPPGEMAPMLEEHVIPYLRELLGESARVFHSRFLRLVGIGESTAAEKVADLLESQDPTVAPVLRGMEPSFRITSRADSEDAARWKAAEMEARIRERIGDYVYGVDDDTLESVIIRELTRREITVGTVESCTGGLVGHRITSIAGSSEVFMGGIIAYDNQLKEALVGVDRRILADHGAVSEATAREMAEKGRAALGVERAISTTGIAGPGGGTPEKPVGLVFMAIADAVGTATERHQFGGNRADVKMRAAQAALALLWRRSIERPT